MCVCNNSSSSNRTMYLVVVGYFFYCGVLFYKREAAFLYNNLLKNK